MNKKFILLIVIILILLSFTTLLFLVNKRSNQLPSKTSKFMTNEILSVELKIHDSLPKSLVIQNDGEVIFTEGEKTNQITVSSQEIESLKQYILDSNFFSLEEKYEGTGCCDFIAHTITIIAGDKTHAVYCYNQCPKILNDLIEKIKSLWPYDIEYYGFS
jgi:hypothetical protein